MAQIESIQPRGHILESHTRLVYKLDYAYRMVSTDEVREYCEKATVEVKAQDEGQGNLAFKVRCLSSEIDFVGNALATEMFQYWQHVAKSVTELAFALDGGGKVGEVQALGDLLPYRRSLPETDWGTEAAWLQWLCQHRHLSFLFAGFWGKYENGKKEQPQVFCACLGPFDLPVVDTMQLATVGAGMRVSVASTLDADRFAQEPFSRYIKDRADCHDIETQVRLDCGSFYQLGHRHWVESAEQYVSAEVANAYNVTFARSARAVDV